MRTRYMAYWYRLVSVLPVSGRTFPLLQRLALVSPLICGRSFRCHFFLVSTLVCGHHVFVLLSFSLRLAPDYSPHTVSTIYHFLTRYAIMTKETPPKGKQSDAVNMLKSAQSVDQPGAIDLTNIIELNYPPTPYLHEDQDKKR